MKAFTTSKASGLIVSVPEGIKNYCVREVNKTIYFLYNTSEMESILPLPFPCTFLGLSHELTEQEKEQIVEMEAENVMIDWDIEEGDIMGNVYRDYEGFRFFYKPSKSFDSLLLSLGLNPKENLAILINDKK